MYCLDNCSTVWLIRVTEFLVWKATNIWNIAQKEKQGPTLSNENKVKFSFGEVLSFFNHSCFIFLYKFVIRVLLNCYNHSFCNLFLLLCTMYFTSNMFREKKMKLFSRLLNFSVTSISTECNNICIE